MALSRIRWRLRIAQKVEQQGQPLQPDEDESTNSNDTEDAQQQYLYPKKFMEGIEKGTTLSDRIEYNQGYFPGFIHQPSFSTFHSDLIQYLTFLKGIYETSTGQALVLPEQWPPFSLPVSHES